MEKVRIGVVGLGGRGSYHAWQYGQFKDDCEVTAVCDIYQDRVEGTQNWLEDSCGKRPVGYNDYREMFQKEDLDGVIIATSWTTHTRIAVAAMRAGIRPATEVYGAASLEECWELVHTYEQTGVEGMFLENCNFNREELCLLNMVKQGLFGEIIHMQCGYEHCLKDEITHGVENRHYRFNNYHYRNGDLYPTHGLGPMAKLVNINRGNRFMSIVSVASKQRGLELFAKETLPAEHPANNVRFKEGDVVTSIITCANGETILLTHDTSSPRPYSRAGRVQGTRGIWMEDRAQIHIQGECGGEEWKNFSEFMDKYDHPIWKRHNTPELTSFGHGGMDYITGRAFVDSIKNNCHPSLDVYDWASLIATTVLSEQSVALGGMPQFYPDFTNGSWLDGTTPKCDGFYCLD